MKTKTLLVVGLLAGAPFAAVAGDGYHYDHNWMGMEGPYLSAFGGWNNTEDDAGVNPDDGWVGGIASGGKTRWARAELEASYRSNDIDSIGGGEVTSTAIMGNAYWDIETNTRFTPYLGAGIGAAYVDFDTAGGDDSVEFAYQGMAGANFALNPNWSVGAEYRYFATTQVDNVDYNNHAVLGNVRYSF